MLTAPGARLDFEELRAREFAQLDGSRYAYLDYAGAALPSRSQLDAAARRCGMAVFGNPHSEHEPSRASSDAIDDARTRVRRFLDAPPDEYAVCFTANTTASIKLVAEGYPFNSGRGLLLTADNHNSVNGIREFARRGGAPVRYVAIDSSLRLPDLEPYFSTGAPGLFALPAQSNFSGVKHPLALVEAAHRHGYDVLLDIAGFVATSPFSLRECPADFVALSFYKLFGFPTGVGALVARRSALARLARPWFSGGTVVFASVQAGTHRLRALHEAFEDGTPNFLGIATLGAGFDFIDSVGMDAISNHVRGLTARLLDGLTTPERGGGAPLVRVYGPRGLCARGGTVTFNINDQQGSVVPFADVERRAREYRVALRGGCFCNPGASEAAFGFDRVRTTRCLDALGEDFTVERFAACMDAGTAIGAVRLSIGLANSAADIDRALDLVRSYR